MLHTEFCNSLEICWRILSKVPFLFTNSKASFSVKEGALIGSSAATTDIAQLYLEDLLGGIALLPVKVIGLYGIGKAAM